MDKDVRAGGLILTNTKKLAEQTDSDGVVHTLYQVGNERMMVVNKRSEEADQNATLEDAWGKDVSSGGKFEDLGKKAGAEAIEQAVQAIDENMKHVTNVAIAESKRELLKGLSKG